MTSSQVTSSTDELVAAEVNKTLAKRSVGGVFAYFLLLAIFFATSPAVWDHPTLASVVIAWMTLLGCVRLLTARRFEKDYALAPARWAMQFRLVTVSAGLSWGIVCAGWTYIVGLGASSLLAIISIAGIAAGATSSLGPSVRVAHTYLCCILGPSIVGLAVCGDGSRMTYGFVAVLTLFLAFVLVESKHVCESFVLAIRRAALLEQRANDLNERTRRMKLILDTVGQGFLSVTLDGRMANERSTILERWLGPCRDDDRVWEYLARSAPEMAGWLELGLGSLSDNILPAELVAEQLPRQFRAGDRHIEVEYRLSFEHERVARILMILSDVASEVGRRRGEQEQRELLNIFERITTDRSGVIEFVQETERLTAMLASDLHADDQEVLRWIHTLKGNSGMFGLEALADLCHSLESTLEQTGESASSAQRTALRLAWQTSAERIRALIGGDKQLLQVSCAEYSALLGAIEAGVPRKTLAETVRSWELEPTEFRLLRIAEQARNLARRMEKGEIDVVVESNGLRLPLDRLSGFWSAFVHVVRNAVDHGLESPEDRVASGKSPTGTLTVRTFIDEHELVVSLQDDGRGIDWEGVAKNARWRGLPDQTPADLEQALFADGVSTKFSATEFSGRGVGMGAVLSEVRGLGGRLTLSSEPGRGTCWMVHLPRVVLDTGN